MGMLQLKITECHLQQAKKLSQIRVHAKQNQRKQFLVLYHQYNFIIETITCQSL